MAQGHRPDRVGDLIRQELSDLLTRGAVHDPGIGFITLTRVKVSPDLQLARVFYTSMGDERALRDTARALDRAGIELNYNTVPYDPRKPFDPSGIRLGSPSVSSRGMGEAEMKQIASLMDRVISNPSDENADKVRAEVKALCAKFPAPGISA